MKLKNNRGQSLLEYLILLALMAVATIGTVRVLNQNLNAQFANIIYKLQGSNKKAKKSQLPEYYLKNRDLKDFMNGASNGSDK